MTNAAKATVWTASWLPWGGVQAITGTGAFNLRFPGQWFQLETGLHYNWHRSYDPTLGRYTQPDPLGFVDGPSVYGYAGGAPGQAVDPFGLSSETPKPPVIIDPRTGEQVYPPKTQPPTQPYTEQPPAPPPPVKKPTCETVLISCMAKCTKSPLCKANKAIDLACRGFCLGAYYACIKKGQ
jgi:RHS repeat-associated protein